MHVDITDLNLFVCIAESPSLTQGAKKAFLSAAAASVRIKSLEEELKTRLFYRDSKGVELTASGKKLLKHARVILRQLEYLKNDFALDKSSDFGHIRIYANTTATTEYLPDLLAYYLSHHPGVSVDLKEKQNAEIIRSVSEGGCDIGIVAGDVKSKTLEVIRFASDELVLVVPANHPLSNKNSVNFIGALKYPLVSLNDGSTLVEFLKSESNKVGEALDLRIQVFSFESVLRMVDSGVGVAVVPYSAYERQKQFKNVKFIKLDEPWSKRDRYILVRDLNALPLCAIDLINKILSDHGINKLDL
ncbi:LysR substrate-binding domain-containing protein [Marinobacterium rhizophilum]|uniref:LysR family transcriptional regulator n=1 Tax=Marinobacterium rhizophilum TaxID=420402 RepID=UPI000A070D44|nr:LysR substrate-binding domain-containing protein [Marinobacterium rhizophilum]